MADRTEERYQAWSREVQSPEAILARVEQARQAVDTMCQWRRWTMCIPVQDEDSDIVIVDVFNQCALLVELLRSRTEGEGGGMSYANHG